MELLQPNMMPTRGLSRNALVDAVRAFSIVSVIGGHYFVFAKLYAINGGVLSHVLELPFRRSYFGVTIFFVVSGFLITSTSITPDMRVNLVAFYIRRATRILPLLLFSLALGTCILPFVVRSSSPAAQFVLYNPAATYDPPFWIAIVTFWFNWLRILRESASTGWGLHWDVLWSLAVEEQFYVVFPAVVLLCRQRIRPVLVAAAAGSLLIRAWLWRTGAGHMAVFYGTASCVDALALGSLAALSPSFRHAGVVGALVAIAGYMLGESAVFTLGNTLVAMGIALLLGWSRTHPISHIPRLVARFGQLSFGLYLLHPLTLLALAPLLTMLPIPVALLLYLGACFVVAEVSFRMFEGPVERSLRRRFIPKRERLSHEALCLAVMPADLNAP